jgi:hypothetical protein
MQAIEFSTEANLIRITIERNALSAALLAQVTEYLQSLMERVETPITASALRRLPSDERKRIIAEQFAQASKLYEES